MNTEDKQLVFFGTGVVAEKILHLCPEFIVDNNPNGIGTSLHGVDIKNPEILNGNADKYDVIVCTTSVGEVKKQLERYGYTWGENANVSDLNKERVHILDLEENKFKFLISCGLPSTTESLSGGGIYKITETDLYPEIVKIYEGNTHGLVSADSGYAFTSNADGLVILDDSLSISNVIPLVNKNIRPHGIRRYKDIWVVVSSNQDAIFGVDDEGKTLFAYPLSDKRETCDSPQHHCNDLYIDGDYAYVSMFSVTGNYKKNVFDGGIVEINLCNGKMSVVINDLTMPHSVTGGESGFMVLNSFKGTLLGHNFEVLATLPGFVRGLDFDNKYYYIGESKNRNFSRLNANRIPVSIDSRITIMNHEYGFSRSIALPGQISEIHSLLALD